MVSKKSSNVSLTCAMLHANAVGRAPGSVHCNFELQSSKVLPAVQDGAGSARCRPHCQQAQQVGVWWVYRHMSAIAHLRIASRGSEPNSSHQPAWSVCIWSPASAVCQFAPLHQAQTLLFQQQAQIICYSSKHSVQSDQMSQGCLLPWWSSNDCNCDDISLATVQHQCIPPGSGKGHA